MKLIALALIINGSVAMAAKPVTTTATTTSTTTTVRKPAAADTTSSATLERPALADTTTAASGVRVALLVPAWEGSVDLPKGTDKTSTRTSASMASGVFVGYAHLPIRRLGYIAGGSLASATFQKEEFQFLRIEGNAAYTINRYAYVKGGLNLNRVTRSPVDLEPNVGLQTGGGVQLTRNIGAEMNLVYMTQKGSRNNVSYDARETGLELAMTGTF